MVTGYPYRMVTTSSLIQQVLYKLKEANGSLVLDIQEPKATSLRVAFLNPMAWMEIWFPMAVTAIKYSTCGDGQYSMIANPAEL